MIVLMKFHICVYSTVFFFPLSFGEGVIKKELFFPHSDSFEVGFKKIYIFA